MPAEVREKLKKHPALYRDEEGGIPDRAFEKGTVTATAGPPEIVSPREATLCVAIYDAALCATSKKVKIIGIWRSMFLRTSTHPVNVIYSIAGALDLPIDPYRKNRSPAYLWNEICRRGE
ncbi:hypothetical protein V502_02693 [Pseudogymnoascus sp. VKM F-4520 (FW-2644)]|nr:hypothetical protein V502_02693 [Pseudogymnoascus sp. VKM F-4520 (FW-2644)]